MRTRVSGGYDSPDEIAAAFDTTAIERAIVGQPREIIMASKEFPALVSGAAAILDYLTQLRPPQPQQPSNSHDVEEQVSNIRSQAHTMVGELYVMFESLRRLAIRHPDIEYGRWQTVVAGSRGW